MKKKSLLLIIIVLVIGLFSACSNSTNNENKEMIECSLIVECITILSNYDKLSDGLKDGNFVPSDGYIIDKMAISISSGETAYDILSSGATKSGIMIDSSYTAGYDSYYIKAINYIYEFSCGSESGWLYLVNDEVSQVGCNKYVLQDGDTVRFSYVCNYSDDVTTIAVGDKN